MALGPLLLSAPGTLAGVLILSNQLVQDAQIEEGWNYLCNELDRSLSSVLLKASASPIPLGPFVLVIRSLVLSLSLPLEPGLGAGHPLCLAISSRRTNQMLFPSLLAVRE